MTDQDKTPHLLDHATARIITELTAALALPLKEAVSAELSQAIKSLPVDDIGQEMKEALSSLRYLKTLSEEMTNTLSSAENSAVKLSGELLPLSRACETINKSAERLAQLAGPRDAAQLNEVNEVLLSLEKSFSDWKGVLKANGRAQTQELGEFSSEVSEQVGWMKSAMPGIVRDILEQILSSRAEELIKISNENISILKTRLTKLEKIGKIILAGGVVFIALLAALFFK